MSYLGSWKYWKALIRYCFEWFCVRYSRKTLESYWFELRAILRENEAKLEMNNFNPLHFFCGGRFPGGMNKNSHIWIGRCIVVMVTALDQVGETAMFLPKNSLSRSKNKRVWFSGAREPIQVRFIQMVEPLFQFIKFAIKEFWVL